MNAENGKKIYLGKYLLMYLLFLAKQNDLWFSFSAHSRACEKVKVENMEIFQKGVNFFKGFQISLKFKEKFDKRLHSAQIELSNTSQITNRILSSTLIKILKKYSSKQFTSTCN